MKNEIVYFLILVSVLLFDTFRVQLKYNQNETNKKKEKYDTLRRKLSQKNEVNMDSYNIVSNDENLINGNWHPNNFMNKRIVVHKN